MRDKVGDVWRRRELAHGKGPAPQARRRMDVLVERAEII